MPDTVMLPKEAHTKDIFQSNNSSTTTLSHDTSAEKKIIESPSIDALANLEKSVGGVTAVEKSEADNFPDGGWPAWSCLFGTWWMVFFTNGAVNSFGVYEQYYAKHLLLDKTMSQIAWIGAIQLFFIFVLGVVAGRLFDMGYLRPLLATATVMLVL
jgi:hypothetical protein